MASDIGRDEAPQLESAEARQAADTSFFTMLPKDYKDELKNSPVVVLPVFRGFEYAELPGPGHVRLLHLHPIAGSPIRLSGSLRIHKFDSICDYEAISYTWGDWPELNNCLFLDGQVLKITDNLFAALVAYTDRVTRVLWVDAVCINQKDKDEKAQQVSIMADIYSKATAVQVWLAPHHDIFESAMEFMKRLSHRASEYGIDEDVGQPRVIRGWPSGNLTRDEAEQLIRDALKAHVGTLLLRAWFDRVWVVQESALATRIVVSCGITTMEWTPFARALEVLRGAYRLIPFGEEHDRFQGVKPAWELVRFRDMFRFFDRYAKRNHHVTTELVARLMANKACTDDRDRVYAMLSMTRSPYSLSPDYNLTVAEAYTEFTRHYSPNTQIHFAGLCRRQPESELQDSSNAPGNHENPVTDIANRDYLPSWVPELRPSRNLAWASPFSGAYSTLKKTPFFFLGHPETRTIMYASGTIFDVVVTMTLDYRHFKAPYCAFEAAFYFSLIDQLQSLPLLSSWSSTMGPIDQDDSDWLEPVDEPLWSVLMKTFTGGFEESDNEHIILRYPNFGPLEYLRPGSDAWLERLWRCFSTHCLEPSGEIFQQVLLKALGLDEEKELSADAQVARGFLIYLANILVSNRLFVTHCGYVGLAPSIMQPVDLIAVFNGCSMPYIVRPANGFTNNGEQMEEAVHVIGPCYVHGIMKGEIVEKRDEPRFERLKWTRLDGDTVDSLEGCLQLI